jgi:hypothetical protein
VKEIHLLTGSYTGISNKTDLSYENIVLNDKRAFTHIDHSSQEQFQQVQQASL